MDVLWIILIAAVLLGSLFLIWVWLVVWDNRKLVEKAWQIKASEESERRIAAAKEYERRGAHPEHQQPDIPVWRDKPTGIKE